MLLARGLGVACCAAAAPLVTPVVVAAAPGENRLVVIVLRGGMDGLAAFPPLDDPDLASLRPTLSRAGAALELDGRFGMHAELAPLLPMWRRGQLAVAQAVATPYRGKRSHFDGQDLLEAGVAATSGVRDGWVNRALGLIPDARAETALSVGPESMLLMRGAAPVPGWAPGARLRLRNDARGLLDLLYEHDPLFQQAAQAAEELSALDDGTAADAGGDPVAAFAGERLAAEARIAAFSIGDWDTHARQAGAIARPLARLARAITTLEAALGPAWDRTLVIAMTEFGRTARENGTGGTDHGTGGAALLAGGALAGRARARRLARAGRGRAVPGARPDADDRRAALSGAGAGRAVRPRPRLGRPRRSSRGSISTRGRRSWPDRARRRLGDRGARWTLRRAAVYGVPPAARRASGAATDRQERPTHERLRDDRCRPGRTRRPSCGATSPTPAPGPGEALVRHAAIGLNFIDVYHRTGLYPWPVERDLVPGSEGAGVVEAVGPGVDHGRAGRPRGLHPAARRLRERARDRGRPAGASCPTRFQTTSQRP